jgi:hypothetical protein
VDIELVGFIKCLGPENRREASASEHRELLGTRGRNERRVVGLKVRLRPLE